MKYTASELCLIWLDSFLGLEYKHKQQLYSMINGKLEIKAILTEGKDYITSNVGENEYNTLLNSANQVYLDYILDGLDKRGIKAVTIESKDYPERLKQTAIPPLVLYTKGDVTLLNEECFAMVGSRKSLPLSISIAKDYAKSLSDAGFVLVTGIAQGVDSTVLETGIKNGKKVISVIAGGFDNLYPKSNQLLLDKVVENGLVISEYPPEVQSKPYFFPIRNRIIAGLSKGVLIVSGGMKSGTIYTAEYAEEYGRDLFSVPYSVGIPSGAGCNDLIKRGAMLTDSPTDVLKFYGKEEIKFAITLSESEKQIVALLKDEEQHVEKICSTLGKKIFEVTPLLSVLEIKGVVIKNGVNVYGLSRSDLEE